MPRKKDASRCQAYTRRWYAPSAYECNGKHDEWIEGYLARVMQHEFDHLDAHLFIDHISPLRKQLIKNKLKAIKSGRYQCDYRTKQ